MTPLAAQSWLMQLAVVTLITCISAAVWWFLVRLQGKSANHEWRHVWAIIKQDPVAVAQYRIGIYIALAILVSSGFSRFIG